MILSQQLSILKNTNSVQKIEFEDLIDGDVYLFVWYKNIYIGELVQHFNTKRKYTKYIEFKGLTEVEQLVPFFRGSGDGNPDLLINGPISGTLTFYKLNYQNFNETTLNI